MPPAHEHFICNLLRQKLFSAIDGLPGPSKTGQRWLLFLPENEHHEMGLLFAQFLLRQARQTVFYLGTGVPRNSLPVAIEKTRPDKILMSFVRNNEPETAGSYLDEVSAYAGDAKVFVSGNENLLSQLSFSGNQMWIKNVEDLEKVISETMGKLPENMN